MSGPGVAGLMALAPPPASNASPKAAAAAGQAAGNAFRQAVARAIGVQQQGGGAGRAASQATNQDAPPGAAADATNLGTAEGATGPSEAAQQNRPVRFAGAGELAGDPEGTQTGADIVEQLAALMSRPAVLSSMDELVHYVSVLNEAARMGITPDMVTGDNLDAAYAALAASTADLDGAAATRPLVAGGSAVALALDAATGEAAEIARSVLEAFEGMDERPDQSVIATAIRDAVAAARQGALPGGTAADLDVDDPFAGLAPGEGESLPENASIVAQALAEARAAAAAAGDGTAEARMNQVALAAALNGDTGGKLGEGKPDRAIEALQAAIDRSAAIDPAVRPAMTPAGETAAVDTLDTVERPQLAARLADTVHRAVLAGDREVRLVLNPPQLGHLDVRITETALGVRIVLEASSAEARDLLRSELPALQAAMEARDLRVERVQVQQADQASLDARNGGREAGARGEQGSPWANARGEAGADGFDWSPLARMNGATAGDRVTSSIALNALAEMTGRGGSLDRRA